MKYISAAINVENHLFWKRDLTLLEIETESDIPKELTVKEVTRENVDDVREFRGDSVLKQMKNFQANGCHGAYGYINGACIGHTWLEINHSKGYKLSNEGYLLLPGENASWYGNVDENFRGKRIINHLRHKCIEVAISHDSNLSLIHILPDNESGARAHKNTGGIIFEGRAKVLNLLFHTIVFYKANDRWCGFVRIPFMRRGAGIAWSESHGFGKLLVNN
ncbi:hypothetical protein ACFLUY_02935 [Chloroflexota bacterium]